MKLFKTFSIIFILALFSCKKNETSTGVKEEADHLNGQLEVSQDMNKQGELYYILKEKDSLMFELSYNQLDTSILEKLSTDDIEFYHDQGGATYTKDDFIKGMSSLGTLTYKARREVVQGSIEVYPMYNNGELYGGILKGIHSFYAKEPNNKPEYLTSTAKYTTLWILEDNTWKMSRIYSYDHQAPEN